MRVIRKANYEEASRACAELIASQIRLKPDCKIGLATGSTPVGTYKALVDMYKEGSLDFSAVTSANLDEYRGLGGDHDQSYRYFMNTNLFDHVNIDKSKTYVPDGLEADAVKACTDYDAILKSLGHLDIQLLGIGGDGHIGFNEPADAFCVNTQCIDLEKQTIEDNARLFFNGKIDEVPTQAYTMGIGYIMKSTTVILMATGAGKKDIVEKAFTGPVTPSVPASILQLHPNVVVIGDEAAISDKVVAAAD